MRNKLRPQPRLQSTIRLQRIVAASIAFLLIAIGALVWFQMGNEQDAKAANLQGYDYKKIITIDHNKVAGSTDLVDFPVLIYHTDPDLRTVANGGYVKNANGVDIRTALADGTQLKQELESYDPSTGEIALWVNLPSLAATTDTEIHLYFGNDNPQSAPAVPTVWDNRYKGVYHFAGNTNDATESWDAVRHGNSQSDASGFIGEGEKFDGNGDYLTIHQSVVPNTGGFSLSFWVKMPSFNGNSHHYFFDMEGSSNKNFYATYYNKNGNGNGSYSSWSYDDNSNNYANAQYNSTFPQNAWAYVVVVGGWNDNTTELYINGALVSSDNESMGGIFSIQSDLYIAANKYNNGVSDEIYGTFDELRIAKEQFSSDWISTEYNNQNSPSTFYSIGCLINVASTQSPTTLAGYTQRIELTINNNYVNGQSQSDFPVRVSLTDNTLRSTANGGSMESEFGYDAYFTANDGTTALNFQIESYDEVAGALNAWVEVPQISPCYDTKIYLYYGKPGQTSDPSTSAVWSNSNYEIISHFHGDVLDYSANGNNGTNNGTSTNTGLIAEARHFQGSNNTDKISYGSSYNLNEGTASFWFKPNSNIGSSLSTSQPLLVKYQDLNNHFSVMITGNDNYYENTGKLYFQIVNNGVEQRIVSNSSTWNSNTWHFVTVTWSATQMSLYIDGTLNDVAYGSFSMGNTGDLRLGYGDVDILTYSHPKYYVTHDELSLEATVDEFRLSAEARTSEFIANEYNSMIEGTMVTSSAPTPLNPNGWLLPIELSYFTATPTKDGAVELAWETLVEINNDFFTIERSADGEVFEPIMKVSGRINSSSPTRYLEYDTAPLSGYSFYRLKQTDLDGQSETFPIQQVYIAPADVSLQIVQAYPNPTTGPVTIVVQSDEAQTVTAQLIDASGRLRWSDNWSLWSQQERFNLDLSDYAAGYYILQVTTESGHQESIKLLRAR